MNCNPQANDIYAPEPYTVLEGMNQVQVDYYFSSKKDVKDYEISLTTRIIVLDEIFIHTAIYNIEQFQILACVKVAIKKHLKKLGASDELIARTLKSTKLDVSNHLWDELNKTSL
ncbi:hypothetical protein [Gramella sp. AN32]|uniref:Uncharacterized protein n=1 Tax=Christiangramia antarctica TaxID=2058158 RepID=A0ABW5X5P1_9FLAO|nr:hypothetical protein [Gramella sp. AN32]MCM4154511.1 hypothetical protein [Gramella sp. AN32]